MALTVLETYIAPSTVYAAPHALVLGADGMIYIVNQSSATKVFQFNPVTEAWDYKSAPSNYTQAGDMVEAGGKLYIACRDNSLGDNYACILELDWATGVWTTRYLDVMGAMQGRTIETDGTYLYMISWATNAAVDPCVFAKVKISDWTSSQITLTAFADVEGATLYGGHVYAANLLNPCILAKIDVAAMTFALTTLTGFQKSTDDLCNDGTYLYIASENQTAYCKVLMATPATFSVETGLGDIPLTGWTSVYLNGFVYFGYNTSPGKILVLNVDDSTYEITTLPTGDNGPNEVMTDGTYLWFTTYNTSPLRLLKIQQSTTPPVVTLAAASAVGADTATLNGNVVSTGWENPTVILFWGLTDHPGTPVGWDNMSAPTSPAQPQSDVPFYKNATALLGGRVYYFTAKATNSAGTDWPPASGSFLTKPTAPTNVSATDGTHTDKVVLTWTKSTGATGYKVYRDGMLFDTLGDVATYDDVGAYAPTITHGAAWATDGTSTTECTLTLLGASANNGTIHSYALKAFNATGDSVLSSADTGYRGVGALTYLWKRGSDGITYGTTLGAMNPYSDVSGVAGTVYYYRCELTATGAAGAISDPDTGYRAIAATTPAVVTTVAATNINHTSATSGGDIVDIGSSNVVERGICYGTSPNPTTAGTKVTETPGPYPIGFYVSNMAGLTEGTLWHVRAYAINGTGTPSYGGDQTFWTLGLAPPTVGSPTASPVGATWGMGRADVTDDGGDAITERGVVISAGANPTIADTKFPTAGTTGAFTVLMSPLLPSTYYHMRGFATNGIDTGYSADILFRTGSGIIISSGGNNMGNSTRNLARTDYTRVWLIEDRAGPGNQPEYEGLWKAGNLAWPQGDVKLERAPDPDQYGAFVVVDKIPGDIGVPSMSITARYEFSLSDLMRLMKKGCEVDLQVHMGKCKDPQDFNAGWEKIVVLAGAAITNYNLSNLGALDPSERALVSEEVPFSGEDLFEIVPISLQEKAAVQVNREIVGIVVCDKVSCGVCGITSDGCDKVFALAVTVGGSPGLVGEIIFSGDGGNTWDDTTLTPLSAAEDGSDLACVATNLVVVSNDSCSLMYAPLTDILAGTETWTEVTIGFVAGKCPNAIFSTDPRHTWIVGDGGYVYFAADPLAGVVVQDAGSATVQNLNAIHGYDALNLVAVGASNAVLVTRNGGDSWALVVGPTPAVALNTVWMKSADEWLVGTAGGELWYTKDGGLTWTEKLFPGSGSGVVHDIQFSNPTVGWMAHSTPTPAGRILRTVDGGYSWYVTPEGNTSIPANDRITALGPCPQDVNLIFGGGLADSSADGIIVKGS